MSDTLRTKTVWNGRYRDIGYEIQNFKIGDKDAWTFYLWIPLKQLPDELQQRFWLPAIRDDQFPDRVFYDYHKESLIRDIEWHGGCTWYSKESSIDDAPRMVKIGCDYQHFWDDEYHYNITWVESDAKNAIDSLHKLIPNLKVRCAYNGKFYDAADGSVNGYGNWESFEGQKARTEYAVKCESEKVAK